MKNLIVTKRIKLNFNNSGISQTQIQDTDFLAGISEYTLPTGTKPQITILGDDMYVTYVLDKVNGTIPLSGYQKH